MGNKFLCFVCMPLAMAGCSSSGGGFFSSQETLEIGTTSSSNSSNGLPFAVASSVIDDTETAGPINVKIVRALTDWDSGSTRLLISSETLTLAPGDLGNGLDNMTITVGGETLSFVSGTTVSANGQTWSSYLNTVGNVSATGSVYSYEGGPSTSISGAYDTEAFFAFGYETTPSEIAALVGNAVYNGVFDGFGQVLDPGTGDVLANERGVTGTISLTADFDNGDIGGALDGTIGYAGGVGFTADFSAPISGNGYVSSLDNLTCTGASCVSNSDIAGVFYGADAPETSGIMSLDVQVAPTGGGAFQYLGAGGFTALQ